MKYYSITIALILSTTVLFSFKKNAVSFEKYNYSTAHLKNGAGSPEGKTGAPGESSCTSCHSGSAQSGAGENAFVLFNASATPVTGYVPGQTYAVSVSMNSNPSKKGFQATALDINGNMAGTFTAGLNTAINGTTKKYANHKSTSNTAATTAWLWAWTAPSTNVGDVTFYLATNKANGNNNDNGDVIYLSQHIIGSTASVQEAQYNSNLVVGVNTESNQIQVNFDALSVENLFLNIVDASGKSIFTKDLGTTSVGNNKHSVQIPSNLKHGVYFVHLFIGNKAIDKKIML
jgi:hypothetical protein